MKKLFFLLWLFTTKGLIAQSFDIIPLGIYGGVTEDNLSSYLVSEQGSDNFICLDAGTLHSGIELAIAKKTFSIPSEQLLKENIKGYFISHGHLDHIAGLILNSPEDSPKKIYALDPVIKILENYYFTHGPWINFANEGNLPRINKYEYVHLKPFDNFLIENTSLTGQIFELSHGNPYKSSALLIKSKDNYLLYLGDTGADKIEQKNNLEVLWKNISDKVKKHSLKTIFIEVSFPNSQPAELLYGHLTPNLLNQELAKLASFAGKKNLRKLNIIITHLKPVGNNVQIIKEELIKNNPYQVNLIFPEQGKLIKL